MAYNPGLIFRNGHVNTIYSSVLRKLKDPHFKRVRIDTPDNDFLDVDTLQSDASGLAILCHGLEGSSSSNYMKGTALHLHNNGWDVAAMNYRGCSGEMNRCLRMYHSGATEDLDTVISSFHNEYKHIALIGFSLGGNLVLKYCGERGSTINPKIKAVTAISVPVDLKAGSLHIGRPVNFVYQKRFLITLKEKIRLKAKQYPDMLDVHKLNQVNTLYDFDDVYTGPLHGFKNAEDYYSQCSSKQYIADITIPGMIITAQDDPFFPEACYPVNEVNDNPNLQLQMPKYGGHVGFVLTNNQAYWNEIQTLRFVNETIL